MNKLLLILFISFGLIACSEKEPQLDYYVSAGKFYTPSGEIRPECFANFMAELNGDNYIASINVPLCQSADIPYAYGSTDTKEGDIKYTIEKEKSINELIEERLNHSDGKVRKEAIDLLLRKIKPRR